MTTVANLGHIDTHTKEYFCKLNCLKVSKYNNILIVLIKGEGIYDLFRIINKHSL